VLIGMRRKKSRHDIDVRRLACAERIGAGQRELDAVIAANSANSAYVTKFQECSLRFAQLEKEAANSVLDWEQVVELGAKEEAAYESMICLVTEIQAKHGTRSASSADE